MHQLLHVKGVSGGLLLLHSHIHAHRLVGCQVLRRELRWCLGLVRLEPAYIVAHAPSSIVPHQHRICSRLLLLRRNLRVLCRKRGGAQLTRKAHLYRALRRLGQQLRVVGRATVLQSSCVLWRVRLQVLEHLHLILTQSVLALLGRIHHGSRCYHLLRWVLLYELYCIHFCPRLHALVELVDFILL